MLHLLRPGSPSCEKSMFLTEQCIYCRQGLLTCWHTWESAPLTTVSGPASPWWPSPRCWCTPAARSATLWNWFTLLQRGCAEKHNKWGRRLEWWSDRRPAPAWLEESVGGMQDSYRDGNLKGRGCSAGRFPSNASCWFIVLVLKLRMTGTGQIYTQPMLSLKRLPLGYLASPLVRALHAGGYKLKTLAGLFMVWWPGMDSSVSLNMIMSRPWCINPNCGRPMGAHSLTRQRPEQYLSALHGRLLSTCDSVEHAETQSWFWRGWGSDLCREVCQDKHRITK